MSRNRKIGEKGEKIAVDYLIQQGYEILETNWSTGHKEIDIIAKQASDIIFVEVKTRTSLLQGLPEESITERKIKSVTSAAEIYLQDKSYRDIRFDVISIYLPNQGEMNFLHIKDAFY